MNGQGKGTLELVVGEFARRCCCDRPCLIADEHSGHCMKCGRLPTIRLGAASDDELSARGLVRELGRG